jgi:hypothetical protein
MHHHAVEGEERPLKRVSQRGSGQGIDFATHHKMSGIGLELVDGLQLIEPRLGCWQIKPCRQLHETQLSIDVFQFLIFA